MFSLIAAVSSIALPAPRTLTEHVALASMFKNGYAVVVREMEFPGAGEYILEQIPQASLGTLWFSTTTGAKLTAVVNTDIPKSAKVPAQSIGDLLTLNVGKRV